VLEHLVQASVEPAAQAQAAVAQLRGERALAARQFTAREQRRQRQLCVSAVALYTDQQLPGQPARIAVELG
jgi:hypothetical protein